MKFRMLFYRPAKDGKIIDNAIAGWTRLGNLDCPKELICSHQENQTPDENGNFTVQNDYNFYPVGDCWTSTMGQIRNKNAKYNGVCKRPASEVLMNPERWFYCEFDVCLTAYSEMLTEMNAELAANKGYDIEMILNFFLPLGFGKMDKWICSEFSNHHAKIGLSCGWAVTFYDIYNALKDTFSPMRTAKTLHKLGVQFYNLDGSEITCRRK
jgi:hypothetical protein